MKKWILIVIGVLVLLAVVVSIPTSATDIETEEVETVTEQTVATVTTEALIEIGESASFSEVVLEIANKFGISIDEAEELVESVRNLGDKYLADNALWTQITADMDAYPAKWTVIGLVLTLILLLIGLLIKKVISDSTALSKMKISVAGINAALSGTDGDTPSIPTMIAEKNEQINQLVTENESLSEKVAEYNLMVQTLNETVQKVEANSDTSLKMTEELALQILQLLNIVLDRKVPVTTKEARAIWYSATQSKIKEIYEEGVANVNTEKADEKV